MGTGPVLCQCEKLPFQHLVVAEWLAHLHVSAIHANMLLCLPATRHLMRHPKPLTYPAAVGAKNTKVPTHLASAVSHLMTVGSNAEGSTHPLTMAFSHLVAVVGEQCRGANLPGNGGKECGGIGLPGNDSEEYKGMGSSRCEECECIVDQVCASSEYQSDSGWMAIAICLRSYLEGWVICLSFSVASQ